MVNVMGQGFSRSGYVDDALTAVAAGVFVAAVAGDDGLARERRATLLERAQGRRPRSWLGVADAWIGEDSDVAVSWPQGRKMAYATWRGTVSARRRAG